MSEDEIVKDIVDKLFKPIEIFMNTLWNVGMVLPVLISFEQNHSISKAFMAATLNWIYLYNPQFWDSKIDGMHWFLYCSFIILCPIIITSIYGFIKYQSQRRNE